jgi:hypothetical protein
MPCRAPALAGKKRWRMHGGAPSSGAPRGNKNALKQGLIPGKPSRGAAAFANSSRNRATSSAKFATDRASYLANLVGRNQRNREPK